MGTKLGTTGTSTPHDSDMAYPPGMELHGSKWRIKKRVPQDLLRKHPDIKGFQGGSAIDVLGIGRAVEEAGLQGKICVIGLGLPKDSGKYLESGAIQGIGFWDPKDAGIVMNKVAQLLLEGKQITDGMDLGVPGYNKVRVKKGPGKGIIVVGQAWIDVDKNNYKDYPF